MLNGPLEKLKIKGIQYDDNNHCGKPVGEYVAMFNPEKYVESHQVNYDSSQPHGRRGADQKFQSVGCRRFQFQLLVDGTGAANLEVNKNKKKEDIVTDNITLFKQVTGYDGKIHKNRYCTLNWGSMYVKHSVLQSLTIQYTLFHPNGKPLRATLSVTFVEHIRNEEQERQAKNESPDLTHARLIKSSDNLPLMCFEVYNDVKHYFDIARANQLDTIMEIMDLVPGNELFFPPIDKSDKV